MDQLFECKYYTWKPCPIILDSLLIKCYILWYKGRQQTFHDQGSFTDGQHNAM